MAATTVTVQGKVIRPDGSGAGPGKIIAKLDRFGTTDDGGTQQVILSPIEYDIESDGTVGFDIVPNSLILPAGSNWIVTYRINGETQSFSESWDVDDGTDPIDIGDIPRS